ncbi:hypothetical protein BOO69_00075 [Sulfitobacter alexandrii]|uniref:Uncharacterized protein n=1 Tax=Sulfitobacter alexandrii TaxID=1917485 RepID=A0A1J0WCR4_9RHOB|nr:hypothetical protein BOO69_00075 [Sulfitobacter alexandrii]
MGAERFRDVYRVRICLSINDPFVSDENEPTYRGHFRDKPAVLHGIVRGGDEDNVHIGKTMRKVGEPFLKALQTFGLDDRLVRKLG